MTARPLPVIIPPAGWGSRGDEAAIRGLLTLTGPAQITHHAESDEWRQLGCPAVSINTPVDADVVVFGADVFDGSYGYNLPRRMLNWATNACEKGYVATVCGFSFREKSESAAAIADSHPNIRFVARDKRSQERFAEQTHRNADFAPDPAFLMQPEPFPEPLEDWLHCNREYDIIGINVNQYLISLGQKFDQLLDVFKPEKRYVLISHDVRTGVADSEALIKLYNCLSTEIRKNCLLAFNLASPQIKELCKHLKFLITGRLHLGISACSVGVPTSFVDYNQKVRGVAELFNLEKFMWGCGLPKILNELPHVDMAAKDSVNAAAKLNYLR